MEGVRKLENRMSEKSTSVRNSGAPHRSSSPNEINAQGRGSKALMLAAKNWKTRCRKKFISHSGQSSKFTALGRLRKKISENGTLTRFALSLRVFVTFLCETPQQCSRFPTLCPGVCQ